MHPRPLASSRSTRPIRPWWRSVGRSLQLLGAVTALVVMSTVLIAAPPAAAASGTGSATAPGSPPPPDHEGSYPPESDDSATPSPTMLGVAAEPPAGSRFTPVAPVRLLDTRIGQGAPLAPAGPVGPTQLQVTGTNGLPTTGVTAVVLNVTAVAPSGPGHLTVYPSGTSAPLASSLNFVAGQTTANQVTVATGSGGQVSFFSPFATTDVVADLVGWYGPGAQSAYSALNPTRILDTRDGTGGINGPMAGGQATVLRVTGHDGVPASGVTAVVMNVTVNEPTVDGYLTLFPTGSPVPLASNLNFAAGQTVANLVTVPVGSGGNVSIFASDGSVPTIADIAGYYSESGSLFFPVSPTRVLDTRNGTGGAPGRVVPGEPRVIDPAGSMGIGFGGMTAVLLNITATQPITSGFITAYPASGNPPWVSTLNYDTDRTVPNAAAVRVAAGAVALANPFGATHLIADVAGFFAATGPYTRSSFLTGANRAKPVSGYTNGQLPSEILATPISGCTVYVAVGDDLARMVADAQAAGTGLTSSSCYRDYAGQVEARDYWCGRGACQMAAVPGTSNHGWGKAIDFRDSAGEVSWTSPGYLWMLENAWRYGFIHPDVLGQTSSAPEAWHWEWVGDGGRLYG